MADLKVAVIISAVDRFSQTFNRLGGGLRGIRGGFAAIRTQIGLLAFDALARTVSGAIKTFATFEEGLARVKAVSKLTGDELATLEQLALDLGKTTVFTATDVTQAMIQMGQAGLAFQQIYDNVSIVLNLAMVGQLSMADATRIAIGTLRGFNLEMTQLQRVVDIMALAFANSFTDVQTLGDAFKRVGPVASVLGGTLEETAAAIAVLANANIRGEEAGVALRNVFLRLLNPTAEAEKLLTSLGITSDGLAAGMFSLSDIVVVLSPAV